MTRRWMTTMVVAIAAAAALVTVATARWIPWSVMFGDTALPAPIYAGYGKELPADVALPSEYDWRMFGMVTPAGDQSECAASWAFAAIGVMESKALLRDRLRRDFAEQQLLLCDGSQGGCCGGSLEGLRFFENQGPLDEDCAPFTGPYCGIFPPPACPTAGSCQVLPYPDRVEGFYTVDTGSIQQIKAAIYLDGPAYLRFDATEAFLSYWSTAVPGAVYTSDRGEVIGGAAVLAIGWDDEREAWLCRGSWGGTAGPNGDGTFWLAYDGHAQSIELQVASFRPSCDSATPPAGGQCLGPLDHQHEIGHYDPAVGAWEWLPGNPADPNDGLFSEAVLGNGWGRGTIWVGFEIDGRGEGRDDGVGVIVCGPQGCNDPPPGGGNPDPLSTFLPADSLAISGRHTVYIEVPDPCFETLRVRLVVYGDVELRHFSTCVATEQPG